MALAQSGGGNGGNGGNGNGGNGRGINGRRGNATFLANNPLPVLVYTVWGLDSNATSGNAVTSGSRVSTLVVYDSGMASWTQTNAIGANSSGCSGQCTDTVRISASDLNNLMNQISASGMFRGNSTVGLNNGSAASGDTTLSTVTVFKFLQGNLQLARTASFYGQATGRLAALQNALSGLMSTNFGSSNINGGDGGDGSGGGSSTSSGGGG